MGKRFGRNQRRRMREQIEQQKAATARQVSIASREIARLRADLSKAIVIDVDVLQDNARFAYEARMSAHMDGRDGWYLAQLIDEKQIAMSRERDRFIEHVSSMMAHKLARTLGDKWGSGRNPFTP